ncbi:MAG: hypothetical protein ACI841_005434 [Planctomycetota bacterium]|jgi:hypothetical protein
MTLATLGWGVWWVTVLLIRVAPDIAPSLTTASWIGGAFAVVGLFLGIFTIRARKIWVLLAGVPIFANGALLLMPFLVADLEVHLIQDQGELQDPDRSQNSDELQDESN